MGRIFLICVENYDIIIIPIREDKTAQASAIIEMIRPVLSTVLLYSLAPVTIPALDNPWPIIATNDGRDCFLSGG